MVKKITKKPFKRASFTLPADLLNAIDSLSSKMEISKSALVAVILKQIVFKLDNCYHPVFLSKESLKPLRLRGQSEEYINKVIIDLIKKISVMEEPYANINTIKLDDYL